MDKHGAKCNMGFGRITKNTQMITGAAAVTLQAREHLQKATTPHPLSPQPAQSTHTGHQEQRHRTRPALYTIRTGTASTLGHHTSRPSLLQHGPEQGPSRTGPRYPSTSNASQQTRSGRTQAQAWPHTKGNAAIIASHKQRCKRHRAHPQRQLRSCPEFHHVHQTAVCEQHASCPFPDQALSQLLAHKLGRIVCLERSGSQEDHPSRRKLRIYRRLEPLLLLLLLLLLLNGHMILKE